MVGGGPAHALVEKDLRFEIAGLHGPRRLRVSRLPPGWALKAILQPLNYRNLDDVPEFNGANTTTEFMTRHIFDKLAEVYGARGAYVTRPDEIADAVKDALAASGPTVIEIPVAEHFPAAAPTPGAKA